MFAPDGSHRPAAAVNVPPPAASDLRPDSDPVHDDSPLPDRPALTFAPAPAAPAAPTAPAALASAPPARIQILPRPACQPASGAAAAPVTTPHKIAPITSPFGPAQPADRDRLPRADAERALHPETGIDLKREDRRESFALLRLVAAFLTVGAICAAALWILRAHASF